HSVVAVLRAKSRSKRFFELSLGACVGYWTYLGLIERDDYALALFGWVGLGMVGLSALLYLQEISDHRREGYKTCPDCSETIKVEARVCRFCGFRFEPQPRTDPD